MAGAGLTRLRLPSGLDHAPSPRKRFGRLLCDALPDCRRPNYPPRGDELNLTTYSVEDVGEWLSAEGFGDARRAFAKEQVDGVALMDLNEDELKVDLGVSKLGPRRRFARRLCAAVPGCKNPSRADEVASWSVEGVASWLDNTGLGKYKRAFAKHEVDGMALPDITEDELKMDLGVSEIGLRKRFRLELCTLSRAFCQNGTPHGCPRRALPPRHDQPSRVGLCRAPTLLPWSPPADGTNPYSASGVDGYGVGNVDLAQYVQRAQRYLQERQSDGGDAELSSLMGNLFAEKSPGAADAEGKGAVDYEKLLKEVYERRAARSAEKAREANEAGGDATMRAGVAPDGGPAPTQ